MADGRPQQKFSIIQAGNFIRERAKGIRDAIKKQISGSAISVAPLSDRIKYLTYGISLMDTVYDSDRREFGRISGRSIEMFSNKEVADILKKVMVLRIHDYTREQIAQAMKITSEVVGELEILGVKCVADAIMRARSMGVPLVGG
jgi:hypothetical protein